MGKQSKIITTADLKTPAWTHLEAQINIDLAEARAVLEDVACPPDATLIQRGRIAALKQLLAHVDRVPAADPDRPRARRDNVAFLDPSSDADD